MESIHAKRLHPRLSVFLYFTYHKAISQGDFKKRRAFGARVQRVQKVQRVQRVADCPSGVKVLRIDRPEGRRVLKFGGLSGRGLWYRPYGR